MVKLRLKRLGRRHVPYYRLTAVDSRNPRDGTVLEELGVYDPANPQKDRQVQLASERVQYWLGVGAQPSDTVRQLLDKAGIGRK
ncbi:MAG: 30S ribosomal protein S16 [Phycisphaerae bacterium]